MSDVIASIDILRRLGKPVEEIVKNIVTEYELFNPDNIYYVILLDESLSVSEIQKIIESMYNPWVVYINSIYKAIDNGNSFILDRLLQSNIFKPYVKKKIIIWGELFHKWVPFEILNYILVNEKYNCFTTFYEYYLQNVNREYSAPNHKKENVKGDISYELWNIINSMEVDNAKLNRILGFMEKKNLIYTKEIDNYFRVEHLILESKNESRLMGRLRILKKYNICIYEGDKRYKKKESIMSKGFDEVFRYLNLLPKEKKESPPPVNTNPFDLLVDEESSQEFNI